MYIAMLCHDVTRYKHFVIDYCYSIMLDVNCHWEVTCQTGLFCKTYVHQLFRFSQKV